MYITYIINVYIFIFKFIDAKKIRARPVSAVIVILIPLVSRVILHKSCSEAVRKKIVTFFFMILISCWVYSI